MKTIFRDLTLANAMHYNRRTSENSKHSVTVGNQLDHLAKDSNSPSVAVQSVQELLAYLDTIRPDLKQIEQWRAKVFQETLRLSSTLDRPNFTKISRDDLLRLAMLIDEHHFQGLLMPLARSEGLTLDLSSRMTKVAGKTITTWATKRRTGQRHFQIVISSTLLFQTFRDVDRQVTVTGLTCANRLEALQRVMEHELVHLLEMVLWNDSSCSRDRFQIIARRFFGHLAFKHDLTTQAERAATKFNVRVGQSVRFQTDEGWRNGIVNRITRRATVLVRDPRGEMFTDGQRYVRYYVPLEQLVLCEV